MWLIVGLGNPGAKYALNRHNVGFMAIDALADRLGAGAWGHKFKSDMADAQWDGEKLLLLKPQTYMNLSGEAVASAAQFYKIPPERICVMHDELDLPLADVRLKQGGSAGGHNGLKSIDSQLGPNYLRLRIGIGHPRELGWTGDVSNYVLANFTPAEREALVPVLNHISRHLRDELARFKAQGAKQIKLRTSQASES